MQRDTSDLIESVRRYLHQQKEMYGPELFIPGNSQKTANPPTTTMKKTIIDTGPDLFSSIDDAVAPWMEARTLDEMESLISSCQNCPLGKTRNKFVFGVGNPNAGAVLIGEAPGADEDAQGEPFVGRAGQLLNKILAAIGFRREDVYICNILKCRPPNNRDPLASEVEQCEPYLHGQLRLLRPKIILALGRIAAQTLLRTNETLTALRARTHVYQGIPLMVTFHPAALLRSEKWKKPTWDDVRKFRETYDRLIRNEEERT